MWPYNLFKLFKYTLHTFLEGILEQLGEDSISCIVSLWSIEMTCTSDEIALSNDQMKVIEKVVKN